MRILTTLVACLLFYITGSCQANNASYAQDEKPVYTSVDKEAEFPGGTREWTKFIARNLDFRLGVEYIQIPKKQKRASQTAKVQFIINTEGDISDVSVINRDEVHPKLAEAAIAIIKKSPKWIPAEKDNKKVNFKVVQPVTWRVSIDN